MLFSPAPVFSETIILKDGSKMDGEFEGVMEGVYMVRTRYGLLNVKKEDILTPQNITLKTEETPAEEPVQVSTEEAKTDPGLNEMAETVYEYKIYADTEVVKKIFFENGITVATQTFNLKNELVSSEGTVKDAKYSEYYPDGKLKAEKEFSGGRESGAAKIFYPSGTLQSRAGYNNGLLDGPVFIYSPEGQLIFEQNYKDGILDGWSREYDPAGGIKKQTLYAAGVPSVPAEAKTAAVAGQEPTKKKIFLDDSSITAKKIKQARGEKYIVYFEKKQKAVLTIDKDLNILSKSGNLPDGTLKIITTEDTLEKEFVFKGNRIEKLRLFNPDGSEKANYSYDEKDQAVKK